MSAPVSTRGPDRLNPSIQETGNGQLAEIIPLGLPQKATAPATNTDIVNNMQEVNTCPSVLNKLVEVLDWCSNNAVWIVGHPLFWIGSAMLVLGVGHVFFVLVATQSVTALLVGPTLPFLMLGGLFRELGKQMRLANGDLNTTLGNMLYIPLRFLSVLTT